MRPDDVWDKTMFVSSLLARTDTWKWTAAGNYRSRMRSAVRRLATTLDGQSGRSVQDRWECFETVVWPAWHAGEGRSGEDAWRWGTWAAVLTRTVRPSWAFIESGRVGQWTVRLPDDDPFAVASGRLLQMIETVGWGGERAHRDAWWLGLRVLLMAGIERIDDITDDTFKQAGASKGATVLDAAFVQAGLFDRGPQHGSTRRNRVAQRTAAELVDIAGVSGTVPGGHGWVSRRVPGKGRRGVLVGAGQVDRARSLVGVHRHAPSRGPLVCGRAADPYARVPRVRERASPGETATTRER